MSAIIPQVTLWDGNVPLTPEQHAGNILWMKNVLTALQASGGNVNVSDITQSADGKSVTFTLTNGATKVLQWPVVWKGKGIRVPGQTYFPGDVIRDATTGADYAGGYLVLAQHVADVSGVTYDAAAGKVMLLAANGKDRGKFKDAFDKTKAYDAFDVVTTGTYGVDQIYWQTFIAVAPNTYAPGAPMAFMWGIVAYSTIPDAYVRVVAENKLLGDVVAGLKADIAALRLAVTNHNTRLHSLDNANYTYPPAA